MKDQVRDIFLRQNVNHVQPRHHLVLGQPTLFVLDQVKTLHIRCGSICIHTNQWMEAQTFEYHEKQFVVQDDTAVDWLVAFSTLFVT